jgi:hypothetical protein
MPTPTLHSAISKLGVIEPGAPWCWQPWKKLTGIEHGLNPVDDKDLPKGLTRQQAERIESYHDAYKAKASDDARQAFTKGTHPGREIFQKFITSNWVAWNIPKIVIQHLSEEQLLPLQEMVINEYDDIVDSSGQLAIVYGKVGFELFGEEVVNSSGRLNPKYLSPVQTIVQRVYRNVRNQARRTLARIEKTGKAVGDLIDSESFAFCRPWCRLTLP